MGYSDAGVGTGLDLFFLLIQASNESSPSVVINALADRTSSRSRIGRVFVYCVVGVIVLSPSHLFIKLPSMNADPLSPFQEG